MMILERPFWLILIFVLVPVFLYWRKGMTNQTLWRNGTIFTLRNAFTLLMMIALVGPVITWKNYAKYVVCAVDVSGSIRSSDTFWKADDAKLFPNPADLPRGNKYAFLPYAQTIGVMSENVSEILTSNVDAGATDLSTVLAASAALAPEGYVSEIVLYSDGTYNAGPVPQSAAKNVKTHVFQRPGSGTANIPETWIERVVSPVAGYEGEVVPLDVFVHAQTSLGELKVELQRNGQLVETQTLVFEDAGQRGVRFQVPIVAEKGTDFVRWNVQIFPPDAQNSQKENDSCAAVTRVVPHQRVLLVETSPELGARIREILRKEFIEVESCTPENIPHDLNSLKSYGLVLLSNIPASRIEAATLAALERYVTDFGGGLIVIGGNQAFTSGGYRDTPIEKILPVVCEEDAEREREGLGLVLVVDRSESMKEGDAIGLAKQAVKRALDVLGPQDQVGVLVFADTSLWYVPIQFLTDENKQKAFKNIDSLTATSATNMAPAMERAALALREISAERKHIILMTDGISNPADFAEISDRIGKTGITVSTIALGKEAEPNVLADIAQIGSGKTYVCTDPGTMPQIFAAETASVARLGVVEGKTPVHQVTSIPGFQNFNFTQIPPLLGYIQTRAKIESRVIFESPSGDPLLCWWKCGNGRVVAFTSDMESHWVETWSKGWADFPRFWSRLVTHAIRDRDSNDFQISTKFEGDWLCVFLTTPASVKLDKNPELRLGKDTVLTLLPTAPGVYGVRTRVELEKTYDLSVSATVAGQTETWNATQIQSFTDEYCPDKQRDATASLDEIVHETGGQRDPDVATLFPTGKPAADAPYVLQTLQFWRFFLLLALLAWISEVGFRRSY